MDEIKSQMRIKCKHHCCLGACSLETELKGGLYWGCAFRKGEWRKYAEQEKSWVHWSPGGLWKADWNRKSIPLESRSPAFIYSPPKSESAFGRQSLVYPPEQGGSLSAEGISVENRGYEPWAANTHITWGVLAWWRRSQQGTNSIHHNYQNYKLNLQARTNCVPSASQLTTVR